MTVAATVDEVWDAIATAEGRERWVAGPGDEPPTIVVDSSERPHRISWWWWLEAQAPRHVELWIAPVPDGTRVIAVESAPGLPLPMLAAAFACSLA